jgi:DNA-binding MarR family transcriptional regulator
MERRVTGSTIGIDDQLCFALYTASRAMTGCYRPMLDTLGLTYPQYLVLLVLWERGESTVTDIGRAVSLEKGTLSPLLTRLETAGLVARTRRTDDERSVLVGLTAAGRALEADVVQVQRRAAEAVGLSGPALEGLRDTLHRLTERLHSAAGR